MSCFAVYPPIEAVFNVQPMHPRLDHPNPGWRSRADLSQSTNFRYKLGMNDYPVYQFIKWIYIYVLKFYRKTDLIKDMITFFLDICERSSGQFSTWVLTKDWINHCNRIFQVAKDPKWSPEANLNMVTDELPSRDYVRIFLIHSEVVRYSILYDVTWNARMMAVFLAFVETLEAKT